MTATLTVCEMDSEDGSFKCDEAEAETAGWIPVRSGDEWAARLEFSLWFLG